MMESIVEQLIMLFVFMCAGFVLCKCNILKPDQTTVLSRLEVYVFVPCTVFRTFAAQCRIEKLSNNYVMLIGSAIILVVLWLVSGPVSKKLSSDPAEQGVFRYALLVPNYGYMGYAIAEGVYGSAFLMDYMLFSLPVSFFTYTAGYCMLTGNNKISLKRLCNPMMICVFTGMIFGLLEIPMPQVAETILSKGAACMAPVSMLLTGMMLSKCNFKQVFADVPSYVFSALRLLVTPVAIWAVTHFISDDLTRLAIVFFSLPCGLNTIVFPALHGRTSKSAPGMVCISNLLCMLTIPFCLYFLVK